MSRSRKKPNLSTIAASFALHMPRVDRDGRPIVDGMGRLLYVWTLEEAKLLTADQLLSLYESDHDKLHALAKLDNDPEEVRLADMFWNRTPRLYAEHRQKSRADTGKVAKTKRIRKAEARRAERVADARRAILARDEPEGARAKPPRRKSVMPGSKASPIKRKLNGKIEMRAR